MRRPSVIRKLPVMAAAAVGGALPWLVWNVQHGFDSLEQPPRGFPPFARRTCVGRRGQGACVVRRQSCPYLLVGWPDSLPNWSADLPTWFTLVLLVVLVGIADYRTRARAPGLLATLIVGYLVLYPMFTATANVRDDLRYLYFLTPWLAVAVAALLPEVSTPRVRAVLGATVVAGARRLVRRLLSVG